MAAELSRNRSSAPGRLGLGCAALGQAYGQAHPTDRPADDVASALLRRAAALGIRLLDTAQGYGDSEQRIGELSPAGAAFDVVSKISWGGARSATAVLDGSLEALRAPRLYGILAHSADELLDPAHGARRFAELERMRDDGRVLRVGASVYTPEEARALLEGFPSLDLIQLPMSVFDTRFSRTGVLDELRARGVEVHARSVLLQGVLALEAASLPHGLAHLRGPLERFRARSFEAGLTPLEAAVGFVCAQPEVDMVLVGATCAAELEACSAAATADIDVAVFGDCAVECFELVDPRHWQRAAS